MRLGDPLRKGRFIESDSHEVLPTLVYAQLLDRRFLYARPWCLAPWRPKHEHHKSRPMPEHLAKRFNAIFSDEILLPLRVDEDVERRLECVSQFVRQWFV